MSFINKILGVGTVEETSGVSAGVNQSKNQGKKGDLQKQILTSAPKADTIDLVTVSAIVPPYLITRDATFVQMFEIPPLESSIVDGGGERAFWAGAYGRALSALPSGFKFQLSVFLEPCDPTDDLSHFLNKASEWHMASNDGGRSQHERDSAKSLALATDHLTETIGLWYDHFNPVNTRTVLTIFWQPMTKFAKSAWKSLLNIKSNNDDIGIEDLKSYLPQAMITLGEQADLLLAAFNGAGIPLQVLSPGQMCQMVWRTLHPSASGAKRLSSRFVAENILNGGDTKEFGGMPSVDKFTPDLTPEELALKLAPDTFIEESDYFQVDGVYASGFIVNDFRPNRPANVTQLSSLEGGWCGTMFIEIADPVMMADRLRKRETQLSATDMVRTSKGLLADFGQRQEVDAVQTTRWQLETASVTPVYIRFYVMRTANDLETLEKRRRKLDSMFATGGVAHFLAQRSQALLYQSTIPTGRSYLNQKARNMTPESLTNFFWPGRKRVTDPDGVYVGFDLETKQPVRVDPFGARQDRTPSYLAIGTPGAGKSVWLRTMMTSVLLSGGRVIAIDLEGEMRSFAKTYGGRYIDVGTNAGERINVLDIPPDSDDIVIAGTEHLVSFCEAVRGSVIPHGPEWNALAEAYSAAIEDRGWLGEDAADKVWRHEDAPKLSDMVRILEKQNTNGGAGNSLADVLRPYAQGMYQKYFNATTTFDIQKEHLVIFGLQSINDDKSAALLRVYLWQVLGLIWGEVLRRHKESPDIANHIMLDEVWKLLASPGGARGIENMARRFRKRRAALWMATQQVDEFVNTPEGKTVLGLVGNTFLMRQTGPVIRRLGEALDLSPALMNATTGFQVGEGILVSPQALFRLQVMVPDGWDTLTVLS